MDQAWKIATGVLGTIVLLVLIGMFVSRPVEVPRMECAKTEPCSERDQLIDLRAEIRGKELGIAAAKDHAMDVANFQLATKQLDEARKEIERLARKAETLEARALAGGTARQESLVPPQDYCATLSKAAQEICVRTRPR